MQMKCCKFVKWILYLIWFASPSIGYQFGHSYLMTLMESLERAIGEKLTLSQIDSLVTITESLKPIKVCFAVFFWVTVSVIVLLFRNRKRE